MTPECPNPKTFLRHTGTPAFTLIELLAVITIVAVLAAIIIPVTGNIRSSVRSTQCLSNLRQIGVAARLYVDDNDQLLMPTDWSFPVKLWPYAYVQLEGQSLSVSGNPPDDLKGTIFECPDVYYDETPIKRSYGINFCLNPTLVIGRGVHDGKIIRYSSLEAPEQTVLIGDVKGTSNLNPVSLLERHNNKANVVFMDGHVQSLVAGDNIRKDGDITTLFWLGKSR